VPFEVLRAIADIPPDQLRRCLAQLQAAEFLYEIKIFPDLEYTFKHGLNLASKLPPDRARMRHELRLLLALGPALQQVQGFGADEVETTYTRARELCEQVGEPVELFQALWGLWLYTVGGKARFNEGPRIA